MYRYQHCLNKTVRKNLCSALLQCHFDYCCASWYFNLSTRLKRKLQTSQNKIVRYIIGLPPRSHIGQKELESVNYLNVEDRVKQLCLNHAGPDWVHITYRICLLMCHLFMRSIQEIVISISKYHQLKVLHQTVFPFKPLNFGIVYLVSWKMPLAMHLSNIESKNTYPVKPKPNKIVILYTYKFIIVLSYTCVLVII